MNIKYHKVLLVNPSYERSHYRSPSILSGLGYISEALQRNGIENRVFDMALGYSQNDLEHEVRKYNPDLIGLFLMTYRYKDHYKLLQSIRRTAAKVKIVVGGPHVSTMREAVLKECDAIDYGVVLEGEESLVHLCLDVDPSGIKGVLRKENGEVVYNGDRAPNCNLDEIAFPRYQAFEIDKYPYAGASKSIVPMPIVTSRGCPYSCIYCPVKSAIGRQFRSRSVENIFNEIVYRYEQGYRSLWIADDNFTIHRDRVLRLCEMIIAAKFQNMHLGCGNGIRADLVDREMLQIMKLAGFWYLAFGIESGSNTILKNLKKGYRIEAAEKGIQEACKQGFEVVLFFLLGSPGEGEEEFSQSLSIADKYPVSDVRFYNLIPYPNTELFKWAMEKNYFTKAPDKYLNDTISWQNKPVFATPEMGVKMRLRLFRRGQKMRKRKARKKAI
jgi:anaerobic magnesium-protoporphyrin IX monomethyl ester cyclase